MKITSKYFETTLGEASLGVFVKLNFIELLMARRKRSKLIINSQAMWERIVICLQGKKGEKRKRERKRMKKNIKRRRTRKVRFLRYMGVALFEFGKK